MRTIEYRVRPVTRYVVTRFENDTDTGSGAIETLGEFDNEGYAQRVKAALERHDPDAEPLPLEPAPI